MLIPALATALVYGVGGQLAIDGTLTVGTLVALTTLLLRLLGPLQGLSNVRIDVMTALVSFERVFEVLDLPSTIEEKPEAVALPRQASTVEFDRVAFTYPRADDVSLASLETVTRKESQDSGPVLKGRLLHRLKRPDGRAGGAVGSRQDDDHPSRRPVVRRVGRCRTRRRARRARPDPAITGGRGRVRDPGRAHVPRHDPGQSRVRATGCH